MTDLLPPRSGLSTRTFCADAASALGAEHVLTDRDQLGVYDDPYSFLEPDQVCHPVAVVRPDGVDQVREIVLLAAEHGVPLWTVSRGRNLAYGGASPRTEGTVVLDLSRMNRVLEVDAELGHVVVEPGVSFMDLYAHLRSTNTPLMMSVPDIGWGSVLANALERGIGYGRDGDHSGSLCGLEVVLADGSVLHTGMGALPGSRSTAQYRGGHGPSLEGLFLQSNLGVVTRSAMWLAPRPETIVVTAVRATTDDALGPMVDVLRRLQLDGTIHGAVAIGSAGIVAASMSDRAHWHTGPGAMDDAAVARFVAATGVGHWNARFGLYGPAELTAARLAIVRRALAEVPGLDVTTTTYPGDVGPDEVAPPDRSQVGVPSLAMERLAAWRGAGTPAHTDLSLVGPARGEDVVRQRDLLRAGVRRHGFDYAGGFTLFGRHTIGLALVSFDGDDPAERAAVRQLVPEVVAEAAALGYAPYRSHVAFMDVIGDVYSADGHAVRRTQEKLKDALDPAGVLSPGKQGVWLSRAVHHAPGRTADQPPSTMRFAPVT